MAILVSAAQFTYAEAETSAPPTAVDAAASATSDQAANGVMKRLENGNVEVGGVIVDKVKRSIQFPAAVNMRKGYVEYVLVGEGGKTHESTLVTQVSPQFVHVAMLLLGAVGSGDTVTEVPANIDSEYLAKAPAIKGDAVRIDVQWGEGGEQKRMPLEGLLVFGEEGKVVDNVKWIYNGSMVSAGRFIAQDDQSFISLITDSGALVNNVGPGHANDDLWQSNTAVIPPEGTKVTVEITLAKPALDQKSESK